MSIYLRLLECWHRLSKYSVMASLSHRQGSSFGVLILLFPSILLGSDSSDLPSVTYRTGTSEVRVAFFATDHQNRPVATLNANDFAVVDGEMVIRDFRSLTRSDETALDVVLLLDASESVAPRFHESVENIIRLASDSSRAVIESVSVVTFAGLKPALLCSRDCTRAVVQSRLVSMNAAGSTPLFDSLTFTADFLANHRVPGTRQVVIVFSDGDDTISRASPKQGLEALAATGAIVYAIDMRSQSANSKGKYWLQKMAEVTGGRTLSLEDGTDNVLKNILADLRSSYVVTYTLPNRVAGFHSLRILPKHDLNLQFHCRRGYFYEDAK